MNIYSLVNGLSEGEDHSGNSNEVTAKQFLGVDKGKSYTTPTQIISYCRSLREPEVKQLEKCFKCYKDGLRIISSSTPSIDKGGRNYIFVNFLKPKGTIGVKLILEAGMEEMLDDYLEGKVIIKFSLKDLVEEALKH